MSRSYVWTGRMLPSYTHFHSGTFALLLAQASLTSNPSTDIALKFESIGSEKVDSLYVPSLTERLRSGWEGAVVNAECVVAGLKGLKDNLLSPFLSTRANTIAPATAPILK